MCLPDTNNNPSKDGLETGGGTSPVIGMKPEETLPAEKPLMLIRSCQLKNLQRDIYRWDTKGYNKIKWTNVVVFTILHALGLYGMVRVMYINMAANIFTFIYGICGGLGITAGAHRLWAHKSYSAKLPLRIFLMLCNCIAGQWDIYDWSRDHRVHHKFTETDADPHNSFRGYFFAHIGWLCIPKHPSVREKGEKIDLSDVLADPVVRFQRTFYNILYPLMVLVVPWYVGNQIFHVPHWDAFLVCVCVRYVVSLHCTWLVNSAAHMWGDKPYNFLMRPAENLMVSYGALGEGFHNYHHAFPSDYRTSELGWRLNFSAAFIDVMAMIGQVTDRKTVSRSVLSSRKARVAAFADS